MTTTQAALDELPDQIPLHSGFYLEKIIDLSHGPQVVNLIHDNVDHLSPWFPWPSKNLSLADFAEWFSSRSPEEHPVDYSVMVDGRVAGRFNAWAQGGGEVVEFGYWLGRDFVGRGLISMSMSLVMGLLVDGGVRVFEAHWTEGNRASEAVARRAGFEVVGSYVGRSSSPETPYVRSIGRMPLGMRDVTWR